FVEHHAIDESGFHIRHQFLQRRAIEIAACVTAVIVVVGDGGPACKPLAQDIRFASFSLCLQTVEWLIQSILGRFAGVDGTPHGLRTLGGIASARHLFSATLGNPKNENPFHCVPLTWRATALSERYIAPSY